MFTRSSALALCLSFVSALTVSVPPTAQVGTSVQLSVSIVTGDPANIDLLLCVYDGSFDTPLATDVTVAPTIEVDIPVDVSARPGYFIAAIEPGNSGIIYSKSNLFEIESA